METHQQQMIDWQVALVAEPSRAPSPSAKRPAGSQVEIFRRQSFDQMGNIFLSKALNSDSVAELGARHTVWADGLVVGSRVSISFLIRCSFLMKIWLNCVQSRLASAGFVAVSSSSEWSNSRTIFHRAPWLPALSVSRW